MDNDKKYAIVDGNTAATHVAYAYSDVAAIYPITPASAMGELADSWAAKGRKNVFDESVDVIEMQSEAGASGAVHGSLSGGALTSTFTNSQGLLLMMPNMFKMAGELLPAVIHVAARSIASQSLSIFGEHSDVMAIRPTGFAILSSNSVQEAADLAIAAHLTAIESRVPFVHFFDGFRTSNEVQKVELPDYDILKEMLDLKYVRDFRDLAQRPEKPRCKVGAENPDVFFQGREAQNRFYDAVPMIVKKHLAQIEQKLGRKYELFDYVGHPEADRLIISMGSSCETIEETIDYLNNNGYKVGLIKVRLFRPFSIPDFLDKIPGTVTKIAVLDRTKEPGSLGEPLYQEVVTALKESKERSLSDMTVIGGRYGLSSKEFTPAMVKAVYDHLNNEAFHSFSVGIDDDVTHRSILVGEDIDTAPEGLRNCKFWGLGSDGTVSANKNSIKIIGESTDMFVQAFFQYDSKKSGGITVSHLRFGKSRIKSQYLLTKSDFIGLHNRSYIGKYDILKGITENGVLLINSPWKPEEVFKNLSRDMQEKIIERQVKIYTIDATAIAKEAGLPGKINVVMQAAFFQVAKIIPPQEAKGLIEEAVKKTFKKKGQDIIDKNIKAIQMAWDEVSEAPVPDKITESYEYHRINATSEFEKNILIKCSLLVGDQIPVSQMTVDGSIPTGTTRIEKRGIANEIPRWLPDRCIQCGQCSFVCPHASIRVKQIDEEHMKDAPEGFVAIDSHGSKTGLKYRVQVYPEDCVGCGSCVEVCPAKGKALEMHPLDEERARGENENQRFFENLPDNQTEGTIETTPKGTQVLVPMFEFSGACAGCGETPYIKLVTQLFGDRMIIANATGCSSIYGGTFPVCPYTKNKEGRGPAWANSLFEDNAEYGFGMKLAVDSNRKQLKRNLQKLVETGTTINLKKAIEAFLPVWDKTDEDAKAKAKAVDSELDEALKKVYGESKPVLEKIVELRDYLLAKSVWIIGGDGWAYDIGFGGLDHVLAQGKNVNILVLDTEVYSNTGGQSSKATPLAAIAKFASAGKHIPKKNLGLMMSTYGYVYVASVNMGANRPQLIKAMLEAERYDGPSIIVAYSPCIAHGYNLRHSLEVGKKAVDSGYWPLFRYNPELSKEKKNPFIFESPDPSIPFKDYLMSNKRYSSLKITNPDEAEELFRLAEEHAKERHSYMKKLSEIEFGE